MLTAIWPRRTSERVWSPVPKAFNSGLVLTWPALPAVSVTPLELMIRSRPDEVPMLVC